AGPHLRPPGRGRPWPRRWSGRVAATDPDGHLDRPARLGLPEHQLPPRIAGLVWHPTTPENAHLACECGRIWPAGPGAVDRGEREARGHHITETQTQAPFQRRWSQIPVSMLEAMDRALPTPAQLRDHETA